LADLRQASQRRSGFVRRAETFDLEPALRRLTQAESPGAGVWSDAYLAALAAARRLTVVSFDRGFRNLCGADALILPRVQ